MIEMNTSFNKPLGVLGVVSVIGILGASFFLSKTVLKLENRNNNLAQVAGAIDVGSYNAPELPRVYLNMNVTSATGATIRVNSGDNLQLAFNNAQPGDQILLEPGAVFIGNFILPKKASDGWITVRTAAPDSNLPPKGVRINPTYASHLPKILTPNPNSALRVAPGAKQWRLLGLEISSVPTLSVNYRLLEIGDGSTPAQTSLSQIPSEIVLERMYIHGTPTLDTRRCVSLQSQSTEIVDSYITDCHSRNGDSQAIMGWNGPGPYKIVNNYLAGSHETLGFGGPTPGIVGLVPSDMEIRYNHITRPMEWKGVWPVKNLFELKTGQRILFEYNLLENNWPSAQPGFAIIFQNLTDTNDAPWVRVWDVTIRNNVIRDTYQGINLLSRVAYASSKPALLPDEPMRRILISNNLIELGGSKASITSADTGGGRAFQLLQDLYDVTIINNTVVGKNGHKNLNHIAFDGVKPTVRLKVSNNIFTPATYAVSGNSVNGIPNTLAKFAPDAVVTNNIFSAVSKVWQALNNSYPLLDDIGFTNVYGGNYRVNNTSLYKTYGADVNSLEQMIPSIVAGNPYGYFVPPSTSSPTPTPIPPPPPPTPVPPTPTPVPPVILAPVAPPPPGVMPTVTVSVSPRVLVPGYSATITWDSTHATSCVGSGSWVGPLALSGTAEVSPSTPSAYVVSCSNTTGSKTASVFVRIDTSAASPPPPPTPPAPEENNASLIAELQGRITSLIAQINALKALQNSEAGIVPAPASAPRSPVTPRSSSSTLRTSGEVLPSVFKTNDLVSDKGVMYFIRGSTKIPFSSLAVFKGLGYSLDNLVRGDTSSYRSTGPGYVLNSTKLPHPWGSWIKVNKLVYYLAPEGLIASPDSIIFASNGGKTKYVVQANEADLAILKKQSRVTTLKKRDARVRF